MAFAKPFFHFQHFCALQVAQFNAQALYPASGKGQLVLWVADTGRGIAEEHQEKIFSKGFSTKGSNRGIGLYMLLLTLDEVDGSVEIDSRLGHGSIFTVRIPASTLAEGENP